MTLLRTFNLHRHYLRSPELCKLCTAGGGVSSHLQEKLKKLVRVFAKN